MTTFDAILIVLALAVGFPSVAVLGWLFIARRVASEPAPWLQSVEVIAPHDDMILHVRIPPEVKV